jgi:LysM repeat protein
MAKQARMLFVFLIVVIGALGAGSGLLWAKNINLEKELDSKSSPVADSKKANDATSSTSAATSSIPTSTGAVTQAAPAGNRPSSPTDTYTIAQGDTLASIGSDFDLSWLDLAGANGIADTDAIKAGQILIIPKNNQISFTVNQDKAASLQKDVNSGKIQFRLSPVDTVKSDISPAYGLGVNDSYKEQSKDVTSGTAVILATHGKKVYEITLSQPVTKGDKGIWAINSVKLQTK